MSAPVYKLVKKMEIKILKRKINNIIIKISTNRAQKYKMKTISNKRNQNFI
jgi:hypothetical protein